MKKIEKVNTCFLPSPLHKLNNVSKDLDLNVYIKRDDMTGTGLGGNKLRKLDYIVKKAMDEGYTTLLTYGGAQTNHGRLTAAAASKFGLKSIIMCYGKKSDYMSGNLLLDKIMGTEVAFIDTTDVREKAKGKSYDEVVELYRIKKQEATNAVTKKYTDNGEKVYIIEIGGHSKEGILGYFEATKEILDQSKEMGVTFDYVITGNGSGGTLGGLLLGKRYYNASYKIIAANVSKKEEIEFDKLIDFCNETSNHYEMGVAVSKEDFDYTNDYIGIGYNEPDNDTRNAIMYLASKEGIFTDPCYTGKSFNALLGLAKQGKLKPNSNVLYIHTGGVPGLWTEEHEKAFNEDLWTDIQEY